MPFEILTAAPSASDFTPLQEHQEQTPGTFFGAKPVLHLRCADTQLFISRADLEAQSAFPDLRAPSAASTNGTSTVNGTSAVDTEDTQLTITGVDVWVTSQNLLIYSSTAQKGIAIPYPDITLHAIQTLPNTQDQQGLYMQLLLNASDFTPDDDLQTLELTLIPSASIPTADLYAAVSACADLNPDLQPQDYDSEDQDGEGAGIELGGGLPGAGGWITSDNIHEHVDADGNFTGFGNTLGAGAGTVRPREDDFENADEDGGAAGGESAAGGEETKWRRTE